MPSGDPMNRMIPLVAGLLLAVVAGHAGAGSIRFATFNASMHRGAEGDLAAALRDGQDPQVAKVAGIIAAVDPDVILLNEFDYGAGNDRAFVANYLGGAWPFSFIAPSNTGLATGLDLDGDGVAGEEPGTFERARDSHGFGTFEGQYGMVVLSKHEIDVDGVRTFRTFRWVDMPGARLPVRPDGAPFYSDEGLEVLRLSSKSHWDVPVHIGGAVVHVLASHPTPPVFDGPEDRNGARNADEIRFWADYIAGAGYVRDDGGRPAGLPRRGAFRDRGRSQCRPDGRRLRAGGGETAHRASSRECLGHPGERGRPGRGGGPGRGEHRPAWRSPLRYRRLRRRRGRESAGGLRSAFGGARDYRRRSVLAGRR